MMANKIENTEKTANERPMAVLADAMIRGPSGSIEAMEARGTQQLAKSSVLPSKGLVKDKTGRADFCEWAEKCGIKVLGPVEGDDLFVNVELPPGWKQECTDHSMHNDLVDERGRKRAGIFYKAAFYDRKADIRPESRFHATYECNRDDFEDKRCWPVVKDCGEEIWKGEILEPAPSPWNPDGDPCMQMEIARKRAREWLEERYPDHEDLNAYW
jgi:hypothetical protein